MVQRSLKLSQDEASALRAQAHGLEKVIAINNYLRSGSVLLQSLFDWHPDTISTPVIYMSRFYRFFAEKGSLSATELVERFIEDFSIMFDGRGTCSADSDLIWDKETGAFFGLRSLGPEQNQNLLVDKDIFRAYLCAIVGEEEASVSRKFFFQAVHLAYRYAAGQNGTVNQDTQIIYPFHTPIPDKFTEQFAQDFPNARYVLTVRKPIDTTTSMIRHLNNTGEIDQYLVALVNQMFLGGLPSSSSVACNTRAVRLEDLHTQSRETLELLCRWLGLPWHDNLLKSTINGLEWWGDLSSQKKQGLSKNNVSKDVDNQLSGLDRFRLTILFEPKNCLWNYDSNQSKNTFWRKLLCLPTIFVPFATESEFLIAERRYKLTFAKKNTFIERLPKPLVFIVWFFGIGSLYTYLTVRKQFFAAWLYTFSAHRLEAPLLCEKDAVPEAKHISIGAG